MLIWWTICQSKSCIPNCNKLRAKKLKITCLADSELENSFHKSWNINPKLWGKELLKGALIENEKMQGRNILKNLESWTSHYLGFFRIRSHYWSRPKQTIWLNWSHILVVIWNPKQHCTHHKFIKPKKECALPRLWRASLHPIPWIGQNPPEFQTTQAFWNPKLPDNQTQTTRYSPHQYPKTVK